MENRLQNSQSPYLLQHARQPVDWYPWGAEAFARAQTEDKPVLLSIGYSACHWCHTMAKESFSDAGVADIINRNFIPVKVDREERPDIDAVYMHVCQAMTGEGGWPLHVLLTPAQKPFFAGTYYPKEDVGSQVGFKTLLKNAASAWSSRRQEVVDTAGKITEALNKDVEGLYTETIGKDAADRAAEALKLVFDKENGGFGAPPRFPMPQIPLFLMTYGRKYASASSRSMAEKTLQKIHDGALCDHVGGGYFRYAMTADWQKPHYEKMLYDNALLAIAFLEAGGSFLPYAVKTLAFIKKTLGSKTGGFFSAVSANSSEGEGAYYLWDADEVRQILGKEGKTFCQTFHITERSLPYISLTDESAYKAQLAMLEERRKTRPAPEIDQKILTGWNGLAAVAFARAGSILGDDAYIREAEQIWTFLNTQMRDANGRLLARYYQGQAGVHAFAEDYAYLLWALLEIQEATGEAAYLTYAQETWADIVRLFWDDRGGAAFSARDAEKMILRLMEGDDGATPAANAVLALCLYKLYKATGDCQYKTDMEKIFFTFGGQVNAQPAAFCFMLYAKLLTE